MPVLFLLMLISHVLGGGAYGEEFEDEQPH